MGFVAAALGERPMTARNKSAFEVRKEACDRARAWAEERETCGDPEGAECFRDLAREIGKIKIRLAVEDFPF